MKIKWHGLSCFTIEHQKVKIVTDPFDPNYTGLKLPVLTPDFLTISSDNPENNYKEGVKTEPMVFDWPGEYEARDIMFQGITAYHFSKEDGETDTGEIVIFVIRFEDLSICHLGGLGHRMPSRLLDKIGDIDILMIPVGGNGTIDAKKAEEVIAQLEPKVAIPMQYNVPGLKKPENLDDLDKFLKETGGSDVTPFEVYEPKKADLTGEKTDIVVMKISE